MEWRALPPVDWWLLFGGALWSIFWVMVAFFLVLAFVYLMGRGEGPEADPLQLAGQRYAGGEISREELEQIRGDIGDTYHNSVGSTGDDSHLV